MDSEVVAHGSKAHNLVAIAMLNAFSNGGSQQKSAELLSAGSQSRVKKAIKKELKDARAAASNEPENASLKEWQDQLEALDKRTSFVVAKFDNCPDPTSGGSNQAMAKATQLQINRVIKSLLAQQHVWFHLKQGCRKLG